VSAHRRACLHFAEDGAHSRNLYHPCQGTLVPSGSAEQPPEKDLGRPLKRYHRRDYTTVSEMSDSDDDSESSSVDSETDISDTNTSDTSDSDANGPETEKAWRYKYIVHRRLDSQGRRIAKRRWKSTWELESGIDNLEKALKEFAERKRRGIQPSSLDRSWESGAKRRKLAS
jgi:hypothetical protein